MSKKLSPTAAVVELEKTLEMLQEALKTTDIAQKAQSKLFVDLTGHTITPSVAMKLDQLFENQVKATQSILNAMMEVTKKAIESIKGGSQ